MERKEPNHAVGTKGGNLGLRYQAMGRCSGRLFQAPVGAVYCGIEVFLGQRGLVQSKCFRHRRFHFGGKTVHIKH